MTYTIGIDIGGTKTAYGLFDESRTLVARRRHASDDTLNNEAFFSVIADNVLAMCAENGVALSDLKGVGVGMPSFVLFDEGRILKTVNLTNLKDFAARDFLQDRLGVRVVLDNDTHVATLAEHRLGAGRGLKHMVYCAVSTGIASGIVINGELFRGSYGWAGETGHMLLTPGKGELCGCGHRGCFMSYTSGSMIVRHIRSRIASGETTRMTELAGGEANINATHLLAAYREGDPMAQWAVEQMADGLAVWLYNLYETLNISCYVFGGGLVNFGDVLFDKVREKFDALNLEGYPVEFRFAELKDDFGIVGASLLVE
ncbi:MAG: ROK family protein [Clostridia bacterium]|nr:ROK family protein [Clostridia bacterium]